MSGAQYQFLGVGFPVQGCGFKAIWPTLIKIKYSKMEHSPNMRETNIDPHFAQKLSWIPWFFSANLSKFSFPWNLAIQPSSPWTKALRWWSFTSEFGSWAWRFPLPDPDLGALKKNTEIFGTQEIPRYVIFQDFHPRKWTAGTQSYGGGGKMIFLFNWVIFRFHVSFRGSIWGWFFSGAPVGPKGFSQHFSNEEDDFPLKKGPAKIVFGGCCHFSVYHMGGVRYV